MTCYRAVVLATCVVLFMLAADPGMAADAPAPKEGSWVVRDFRFHTGEVLPELRLHYRTIGAPSGEPVLILHGTTGSGASLLTPAFGREASEDTRGHGTTGMARLWKHHLAELLSVGPPAAK